MVNKFPRILNEMFDLAVDIPLRLQLTKITFLHLKSVRSPKVIE